MVVLFSLQYNAVVANEFRARVRQGYVGIPSSTVEEFLKVAFNGGSTQVQPMRPIPMAPNQGKPMLEKQNSRAPFCMHDQRC